MGCAEILKGLIIIFYANDFHAMGQVLVSSPLHRCAIHLPLPYKLQACCGYLAQH